MRTPGRLFSDCQPSSMHPLPSTVHWLHVHARDPTKRRSIIEGRKLRPNSLGKGLPAVLTLSMTAIFCYRNGRRRLLSCLRSFIVAVRTHLLCFFVSFGERCCCRLVYCIVLRVPKSSFVIFWIFWMLSVFSFRGETRGWFRSCWVVVRWAAQPCTCVSVLQ